VPLSATECHCVSATECCWVRRDRPAWQVREEVRFSLSPGGLASNGYYGRL